MSALARNIKGALPVKVVQSTQRSPERTVFSRLVALSGQDVRAPSTLPRIPWSAPFKARDPASS
jgi:hypothetical protein